MFSDFYFRFHQDFDAVISLGFEHHLSFYGFWFLLVDRIFTTARLFRDRVFSGPEQRRYAVSAVARQCD